MMMTNNPYELLRQMQADPIGVLSKRFNIPQDINTPHGIIQHLLNTGQVSQSEVNQAMEMKRLIYKQK